MRDLLLLAAAGALVWTSRPSLPMHLDDPVATSIAHPERWESDHARDADRRPQRILDFLDVKRGMRVADLMAGDGYYTELLSRAVGETGQVFCQNTAIPLRVFADKPLTARLDGDRLPNVVRLDREFEACADPGGLPQDLDAALLVRFYHDFGWQEVDRPAFNRLVFDRLRPGGAFVVVDHHAKPGAAITEGKRLHRVEAEWLKREVTAAGFVFEAESYVLTDEADTLDWNIFDPEREVVSRPSRFVYLFRKPAK